MLKWFPDSVDLRAVIAIGYSGKRGVGGGGRGLYKWRFLLGFRNLGYEINMRKDKKNKKTDK
jgi:hypothetical protein